MKTLIKGSICIMLIVFSLFANAFAGFWITRNAPVNVHIISRTPVHNLDTGLNYTTIQEAINAPETLHGHTLSVDEGIYYEHVDVWKSLSIIGQNEGMSIVDGNGTGNVMTIGVDNVSVSGLTVRNSGTEFGDCGIFIYYSSSVNIFGNVITNNAYAVYVSYSSNNSITENNVSQNAFCGIILNEAFNNSILGNHLIENLNGIIVDNSNSTRISGNDATNNYRHGISLFDSLSNTISGNSIISNNITGISLLWFSTNNTISENNITANKVYGVYMNVSSDCNDVFGNSIINSTYGVGIFDSNYNAIYHNNFIDNTNQAYAENSVDLWNNDYPSGGNYWSNYYDIDDYSGRYQDETGSDGIWDHPYIIDDNNTDNYPFTNPFIFDNEAPVVKNVRHMPLYPNSTDLIYFYADVTDNVGVALVQLNYTEDGGGTWLLGNMTLLEGITYSTSLGPYPQFQIVGFYIIAYDTAGNKAYGSEIVPPLPEPPRVAPVVVSDEVPVPLPEGEDIGYNVTDTGIEIFANVSELDIYGPGLWYTIWYSIDGGITWIQATMTQISESLWSYVIPAFTNILFKIEASDGNSSRIYWIIVGPWKYPIYLYFSIEEQYYPVKGLDFDYEQTGNYDITNNKESYDNYFASYKPEDLDNDDVPDVPAYTYMNPKTLDDGCLVIEYWIYYAFNRYPFILGGKEVIADDHEHDFESVYLWIDIATGKIKKMACSQHLWVNHYLFDVSSPLKAINLGVEGGGHGMALLKDENNDGEPDINFFGYYSIVPGVDWLGHEEGFVPTFLNPFVINPDSFRAQLYPWVIYDPRIPSSKLHLFDDTSILTTGLAYNVVMPQLSVDTNEIADEYQWLTNLIGSSCLMKTNFAYSVPVLEGTTLQFLIMAPLFRQEFRESGKFWSKVSFGWWILKPIVKTVISAILAKAIIAYFGIAGLAGMIAPHVLDIVTGAILTIVFDPVQGSVMDFQGHVLGYSDVTNNLPGGLIAATRNMTNDLYDLFWIMTNSSSDYIYEVRGIETFENYNFTVDSTDGNGKILSFNATGIPIHAGGVHRYVMNWTLLEDDGFGVEVYVDNDGDGVFEHQFLSDAELRREEFEQAITYDIAVKTLVPFKDIVGQGYSLSINVSVENQGIYAEVFNVTVYANTTIIETKMNILLTSRSSTTITFTWNTTGFAKGNYTISAYAWPVPDETDTNDNRLIDGTVLVGVPCDVTGPTPGVPDGVCNMRDIGYICAHFGTKPSSPNWDPNCDVTGPISKVPDGVVNMRDIGIACNNFGKKDP